MGTHTGNVITLANSIIGVSVLAMPFCFKQCGIILSIVMLLFSNITTRLACHCLMKSAIVEKRKNFEMLAWRVFGPLGKLTVELCIIGFMLGTCVAFYVIIGDLAPAIIGPSLGLDHPSALRPSVLIGVAVFVVLPLGLLKNIDSLNGVCAATVAFYFCLVLKVLSEAVEHLTVWDWSEKVYYWRPSGVLQCIPIFSMALSCQTQLFEIFDQLPSTPLDRMNAVVRSAINMATLFYIAVGFFGYIAYCDESFTGNIMVNFSPSMTSEMIKIGFLLSVAVSFPLVIFPCRASIHSLLFSKGYEHAVTGSAHIPETRFQCITLLIVTLSLVAGLLIPNIEIVLGLLGSTIGVSVCVIIPALIFVCLTVKNNNERIVAKMLLFCGLVIMVLGTYANLFATEEAMPVPSGGIPMPPLIQPKKNPKLHSQVLEKVDIKDETLKNLKDIDELAALPELKPILRSRNEIVQPLPGDKYIKQTNRGIIDMKREQTIAKEPKLKNKTVEAIINEGSLNGQKVKVIDSRLDSNLLEKPSENILKKVDRIFDTKKEPPVPVEPSQMKKAINIPIITGMKEEEKVEDMPALIKSKAVIENNKKLLMETKQETQKAINVHEKSDVINSKIGYTQENSEVVPKVVAEEKVQVVNLKTGTISKLKPNSSRVEATKIQEKEVAIEKMAKGVPLPLAIKGEQEKRKYEENSIKEENKELDKHHVLEDALGEKELREKRDVQEEEVYIGNPILSSSPKQLLIKSDSANETEGNSNPLKKLEQVNMEEAVSDKSLYKVNVEEENCFKNESNKNDIKEKAKNVQNSNLNKMEALIKTPSYLSDAEKPLLETSPLLLPKNIEESFGEMPKKRDLKSLTTEQLERSKQTNS